uniref:Uncharacterized protein n=5 Tax=Lygus hesperus TaxID=30085 RepID=A0A146KSK9_LYGHE
METRQGTSTHNNTRRRVRFGEGSPSSRNVDRSTNVDGSSNAAQVTDCVAGRDAVERVKKLKKETDLKGEDVGIADTVDSTASTAPSIGEVCEAQELAARSGDAEHATRKRAQSDTKDTATDPHELGRRMGKAAAEAVRKERKYPDDAEDAAFARRRRHVMLESREHKYPWRTQAVDVKSKSGGGDTSERSSTWYCVHKDVGGIQTDDIECGEGYVVPKV